MSTKQFIVREGFTFRMRGDKSHEKVFGAGEIVEIEDADGVEHHQLEAVAGPDLFANSTAKAKKSD